MRSSPVGQFRHLHCHQNRCIRLVHLFKIAVETVVNALQFPLQFGLREIAITAIHRLDARAIHGNQFPPVQVKFPAQPHKLPKDFPERIPIVTTEVRNRLEVRPQLAQQPDHFKVAMRLRLQTTARPDAIQIPIDIQLQQIRWIVAWTTPLAGLDTLESSYLKVQTVNECIYETNRVFRPHVVVHSSRQKQKLGSVLTSDVCHGAFYQTPSGLQISTSTRWRRVFTQSGPHMGHHVVGRYSQPALGYRATHYLLFIKRLDELHTLKEAKAARTKTPIEEPIFSPDWEHLRWSRFKETAPEQMFETVRDGVFPFIKSLGGNGEADGEGGSTYTHHMKDALFMMPTARVLANVVDQLDGIDMADSDTKGDLYEYMLGKIATAGQNGQFRTPRHIIKLMVDMTAPTPRDVICDPACGTAGFLQRMSGASPAYFNCRKLVARSTSSKPPSMVLIESSPGVAASRRGAWRNPEISDSPLLAEHPRITALLAGQQPDGLRCPGIARLRDPATFRSAVQPDRRLRDVGGVAG